MFIHANSATAILAGRRLQPNLARGAELFSTCAACHGADGAARPMAKSLRSRDNMARPAQADSRLSLRPALE
jgi:mono/diheme cytochrome c family protein